MMSTTKSAATPTISPAKVHAFEEAGLGRAPFICTSVFWGDVVRSCDYCATAIMQVCVIRSRDGRTFIVGNECVNKTGDTGLINVVKREAAAARRQRENAKADARIEAARSLLESARERLQSRPHPNESLAARKYTLLDYVNYLFEFAGRSGKVRAAKIVEEAAPFPSDALAEREEMTVQVEWKRSDEAGRCQAHDWHGMTLHPVLEVQVGSVSVRLCGLGVEELRKAIDAAPAPPLGRLMR